jgi:hypothetical protein
VVNIESGSIYEITDTLPAEAQITIQKALPPEKLGPGNYAVTVTVHDAASRESTSATAKFAVK